jgi:hypothetical protein
MTLHSTATRTLLALAAVAGFATVLLGAATEVAVLAALAVAMVGSIAVRTREDWVATDPRRADDVPDTVPDTVPGEVPDVAPDVVPAGTAAERAPHPQTTR